MNAPQTAKVLKQLFMESSWDYKEVKIWLFTGSISDFFYFQADDDLQCFQRQLQNLTFLLNT